MTWDLLVGFIIIWTVVITPYRIAFSVDMPDLVVVDWIVDSIFWLDIIICFRCGYLDANEQLVDNPKEIAIHYFKFWFWIDFLSAFPFDKIVPLLFPSRILERLSVRGANRAVAVSE